jgi:hypothetical protein
MIRVGNEKISGFNATFINTEKAKKEYRYGFGKCSEMPLIYFKIGSRLLLEHNEKHKTKF